MKLTVDNFLKVLSVFLTITFLIQATLAIVKLINPQIGNLITFEFSNFLPQTHITILPQWRGKPNITNADLISFDKKKFVKEILSVKLSDGTDLADYDSVSEEVYKQTWDLGYSGNIRFGPYFIHLTLADPSVRKLSLIKEFICHQLHTF